MNPIPTRPQTSDPSLVRPAFAFRVRILLLACVALLAWFPARAAEPLDASFTPIGNFPRSDCRQGVVVGTTAYLLHPQEGLLVLDVSTPSAPVLLGSVALGGDAVNLYAVGTTVYVAQQSTGLRVVDASNPSAPVVVGTFNTSGLAQKVWVSGSIAYVADGPSGIHVLDVSNPSDIRRLGGVRTTASAIDLAVAGTTVFVALGGGGFQVYDAADPAVLRRLASVATEGMVNRVVVSGDRLLLVDTADGLVAFDVRTPSAPVRVGATPLSGGVTDLAVSGALAAVSSGDRARMFDVSGPGAPIPAGSLDHASWSVILSGDVAYGIDPGSGLQIYRLRVGLRQTLDWHGFPTNVLPVHVPLPITITSSSGLPVDIRVSESPATLDSGTVTVTGFGTVVVEAGNAGSDTHTPVLERRRFNVPLATFSPVGNLRTDNYANKVQVVDSLAYVADGLEGLQIMDVHNPEVPVRLGRLKLAGDTRDLHVQGNLVYAACAAAGLQVVDVSHPELPALVGGIPTGGMAVAVTVVGSTAYVADANAGLVLVDVSTPASPVVLAKLSLPGEASGLHVVDSLAYVACGFGGLSVVDVRDPKAPVRVGLLPADGFLKSVHVVGSLAYVAAGQKGLWVVDVSQPDRPIFRGATPPQFGRAYGVTVTGNIALVSDLLLGVLAVDVSRPEEPFPLGSAPTLAESYALQVVDGRLFIAEGLAGLRILDLRIGLPQALVWQAPPEGPLALDVPYPLSVSSDSLLPVDVVVDRGPARIEQGVLTITNLGTVVLRAGNPGDVGRLPVKEFRVYNQQEIVLTTLGTFPTAETVLGVDVVGTTAYLASGSIGLEVVDISNPSAPVRLGVYNTTGNAWKVRVVGTTAYVADGGAGLQVLDVSDPAAIRRLSGVNTSGSALGLEVVGSVLYLTDQQGGLSLFDVSDPTALRRLAVVPFPEPVLGVSVSGTLAYVTLGTGVAVVDALNPAAPVVLASLQLSGYPRGIFAAGDRVYVVIASGGIAVLDVSHPASPRVIGQGPAASAPASATSVAVEEGLAYVGTGIAGMLVQDVQDPANPRPVPATAMSGPVADLKIVGHRAYLAGSTGGLVIVDIAKGQPQSMEWRMPDAVVYDGGTVLLQSFTTSGLPIRYRVLSGPATVQGDRLTITGVGRVLLRVEQSGDANYFPATADWNLNVGLPRLGVRLSEGRTEVYWPAGLSDVWLEGQATLGASGWEDVLLPQSGAAGEVRVAVDNSPLRFFRLGALTGLPEPIALDGWNRDVVLENSASAQAQTVDSFGGTWFESGLGGHGDGLPTSRRITSRLDPSVVFELQPYTGSNVVWLSASTRIRSLTLQEPAAYSKLHVLAHSAGGGGTASLRVFYTDGTSSTTLPIVAPDWWDGSPARPARRPALNGLARSATAARLVYDPVPPGFSLHQTDVDLSVGPNAGKRIERLEFTRANGAEVTCILAVSGVEIRAGP
ncbi:MAG: hypothetical protein U1G08_02880 [Verrucomicrobiota bacterium]